MKNYVLAMCQVGVHALVANEHGTLVFLSTTSFQTEYQIMQPELERNDVVQMLTLDDHTDDQIVIAYKDGSVALISCCLEIEENDVEHDAMGAKHRNVNLSVLIVKAASPQLYTIEMCKPISGDHQIELWCGCDSGTIKVLTLYDGPSQLQLKATLNTHSSSADIPQDAAIVQLKSSFSTTAGHMMHALHGRSSVISCWSVCEQPVLNNVIKLTQLSSPGSYVYNESDETKVWQINAK